MYIAMWLDVDSDAALSAAEIKRKEIEGLIKQYIELKLRILEFKNIGDEIKELDKYLSNPPSVIKSKQILDSFESIKQESNKILNDKLKMYEDLKQQIEQLKNLDLFDKLELIYCNLSQDQLRDRCSSTIIDRLLDEAFEYIHDLIESENGQIVESRLYSDAERNSAICAMISLLTGVSIYLIDLDGDVEFCMHEFIDGDINPDEHYMNLANLIRGNL